MIEYEVVWNGAHYGCDADLLFAGIRTPSTLVSVTPASLRPANRSAVADVLPTQRERALTIGEIQARSGASYSSASQTLYRLRQDGVLGSDTLPARGSGRRPCVYWRLA